MKELKQNKIEFLSLVLLLFFFVGMAILDGPEWCVDTASYVDMDFSREPVYPLFLMTLRDFFETMGFTGEMYELPAYLTAAVILQSILWAVAIFRLGVYVYDICRSGMKEGRARFMMIAAMALQVAVACLNRFVAKRGSMYSEALMTESLAMPLFVLFTVQLLKSFEDYRILNCIKLFILAMLICSVRKQMLIVILMWGAASFVLHILVREGRSLKKFSYTMIFVVLSFAAITMFDRSYNLAVRGMFAGHTGNSRGGLCTLLYTADVSDAELFANDSSYPELDTLYSTIVQRCQDEGLTIDSAPGYAKEGMLPGSDWTDVTDHYAESYDVIGFDVLLPMCSEYVNQHYPELEGNLANLKENQIEKELFSTLLSARIKRAIKGEDWELVYCFLVNVRKAFVISNANISPAILIKASAFIYLIFGVLFVSYMISTSLLSKKNDDGSMKVIAMRKRMIVMALVIFIGLAINCVVTGAVIFPQPRYMCYSMGLFYLALCSMVVAR